MGIVRLSGIWVCINKWSLVERLISIHDLWIADYLLAAEKAAGKGGMPGKKNACTAPGGGSQRQYACTVCSLAGYQ